MFVQSSPIIAVVHESASSIEEFGTEEEDFFGAVRVKFSKFSVLREPFDDFQAIACSKKGPKNYIQFVLIRPNLYVNVYFVVWSFGFKKEIIKRYKLNKEVHL